jgi:hypothetical protein
LELSREERLKRQELRRQQRYDKVHRINNSKLEKLCTICNDWYPCTLEYFYKNKSNGMDGLSPWCKVCSIKKSQKNQNENLKRVKQYDQNYYQKNKERKDEIHNKWVDENEEYYKTYRKKYQKNNLSKWKEYGSRYSNKQHKISSKEWEACKQYFNYECAYCGMSESKAKEIYGQNLHKEHADCNGSDDLSNCVPSCKLCNIRKHRDNLEEWYSKQEFFDNDKLNKIHKWLDEDYKLHIDIKYRNNQIIN